MEDTKEDKVFEEYLTYDDVLLVPGHSAVLPSQVDISTRFSRNIDLKIPIVSAAMDTVTECRMAIAMAVLGGIGVIHKNMPIEKQSEEVERVKRYESGMIQDPIVLKADDTIAKAKELMAKHGISGFPVVDREGRLIGLLTKRDIIFEENLNLPVVKVMTSRERLITGKQGITLEEAKEIFRKKKIEKLPLVDREGRLVGLITIKDILKKINYPNATKDSNGRLRVAGAVGVAPDTLDRAKEMVSCGVDALVVDTAHAHTEKVKETTVMLRDKFDVDIVVGNVATRESVEFLLDLGVDGIKVGIGPGSICTTRVIAGIGVPQFSAVVECSKVSKGIPVIADGGIKYSGDITKALAGGADAVMVGSLLAGTEESPGEPVIYEGRRFKVYRGMGSIEAMREGSSDRYFQEGKLVPEGVVARVPYRGPVKEILFQLTGGLRSGMGYVGARNLKELRAKAKFIRITSSGLRESHPHDVVITREPPNYEIQK